MFKSNESVGPMIGGAVIGVAVGMLIERIRSPRSIQQTTNNEEVARPVCCGNLKKRLQNLQIPSSCHKDRSHRHHRRSRSACRSKDAEKSCSHLSVSTPLQQNTKRNVSESNLRSRSTEKRYSSRKLKIDERVREDFPATSTEYLPFGSKIQKSVWDKTPGGFNRASGREACATTSTEYLPVQVKNKPTLFVSDFNDRKAVANPGNGEAECNAKNEIIDSKSYREFIGYGSTESLYGLFDSSGSKNHSEYAKPTSLSCISGGESSTIHRECTASSIVSFPDTEVANCSINATCDTFDKEIDFYSYSGHRTEIAEKLGSLESKEFVTLPTFDECGNPVSN